METYLIVIVSVLVASIAFAIGLLLGKKNRNEGYVGKRLEEYEFYPFATNEQGHIEFVIDKFNKGVKYSLSHKNRLPAEQLLIVGEQNFVRDILTSTDLSEY